MTKGNKLTRPWGGPGTQTQIAVGPIATNFSWSLNPENEQWEVVRIMPDGIEDVVVFSSASKAEANSALREAIEAEYPGLLAQHGGVFR